MNLKKKQSNRRFRTFMLLSAGILLMALLGACGADKPEAKQDASAEGYAKLHALHVHEDSLLTQYKLLDKKKGVYRIPVERALHLLASDSTPEKGN